MCFFFLFKQKTAYEMRISDWSSDVCSSDLALAMFSHLPCYAVGETTAEAARAAGFADIRIGPSDGAALTLMMAEAGVGSALHLCGRDHIPLSHPRLSIARRIVYASEPAARLPAEAKAALRTGAHALLHSPQAGARFRSEEHTSELQSLMRISYAVFCL